MNQPITIVVLGQPIGQGRPRFVRKTGIAYTPEKTRNNAEKLNDVAQRTMKDSGRPPMEGPVRLEIIAEFQIPKSWAKRRKAAAAIASEPHISRPDASNIVKQVEDALNGVVFRDDRAIASLHVWKRYGPLPRLIITVSSMEPAEPSPLPMSLDPLDMSAKPMI